VCCHQEEELKKSVLCVFANKQDIEGAMTVTEVANALGLSAIKNRKYQIFKTSAIKGDGLDEAMEWCVFYVFTGHDFNSLEVQLCGDNVDNTVKETPASSP